MMHFTLFERRSIKTSLRPSITTASANSLLDYYKSDCICHMLRIQELTGQEFADLSRTHAELEAQFWSAYSQSDLPTLKVLHSHFISLTEKFDR